MRTTSTLAALAALVLFGASCNGDDSGSDTTAVSTTAVSTTAATTTVVTTSTVAPTTTAAPTTAVPTTTVAPGTTLPAGLEQPAIWPAADVVFATPEDAATDFVATVFNVPVALGDFQQGDLRSGEIDVFVVEGNTVIERPRATLLMRQLGPDSGWFVIGAVSGGATITDPEAASEVPVGPLSVSGEARGFESTIVFRAFVAGSAEPLDQGFTQAGNFDQLLPYTVTVNLEGAEPGDVVVLLVGGSTGLETDTGEFAAIPVLITA